MPVNKTVLTLSVSLAVSALATVAGSAHATPSGLSWHGPQIAAPLLVPVRLTDGSEFQWKPRGDLAESWSLRAPDDDPDDFENIYERATMFGDAISELRLGLKYYKGEGVMQDFAAAAKWLRLSAQQGNHTAQAILGYQYYSGAGVSRDLVEANLWVTLALATLPDGKARDSVVSLKDAIQRELTNQQRSLAEQRLREWYAGTASVQ